MEQQVPLPNKPPHDDEKDASWFPAWMSERERMAAIIALGIIFAAFVIVCGGCCGGVMEWKLIEILR